MAKYRILLILAFAWLTFLFNIERIDILDYEPFINLDTLVYIFTLGVTMLIMAFPNLGRLNFFVSLIGTNAAYIFTALLVQSGWAERDPILIVLEVLSLSITLIIMREVSDAILQFEMTVESFVLDVNGTRLLTKMEGTEEFNHEMYRARRFDRPFALIYVEIPQVTGKTGDADIETDFVKWKISSTFKNRFLQVQLAKIISNLTYQGDLIIEHDDAIVVGLPETSDQEATVFIAQLSKLMRAQFGQISRIGAAIFPTDGLIYEQLVQVAKDNASDYDDSNNIDSGLTEDTDSLIRTGDVLLSDAERLKIAKDSEWLSRLAYQSYSARTIYMLTKRFIDIALVILALPLVLPIGIILAILIMIDDPGTPFYMQERTGYGGRRFKMFKFRSMILNAPEIKPEEVIGPDGVKRYIWPDKVDRDPRITRIGRFIRKASLDELPQLINVLIGDMSIVGPRPSSWALDKYTLHQTQRLMVRPGITGLWQVCARDSKNMDERLLWDMHYIEKISLWLDIQIIWRTVMQVFAKGGV